MGVPWSRSPRPPESTCLSSGNSWWEALKQNLDSFLYPPSLAPIPGSAASDTGPVWTLRANAKRAPLSLAPGMRRGLGRRCHLQQIWLRRASDKQMPSSYHAARLAKSEDVEVLSFGLNPGWSLTWQCFRLPYLIARHKARSFNSACSGQGLSQMPMWVPGCTAPQVPGGHPAPPVVSLQAPLALRPHAANSSHHPWKKQNLDSFTTKVLAEHQSCRA